MRKKKLMIQTIVCVLIASVYLCSDRCENPEILKKRAYAIAEISKHYTLTDLWGAGKESVSAISKVPEMISEHIIDSRESQRYGDPLDVVDYGETASVYSVSGGQVIETGTNETGGEFVKIKHDNAVSVYMNCSNVFVKAGEHVRKGHIIGNYINNENTRFNYELIEE